MTATTAERNRFRLTNWRGWDALEGTVEVPMLTPVRISCDDLPLHYHIGRKRGRRDRGYDHFLSDVRTRDGAIFLRHRSDGRAEGFLHYADGNARSTSTVCARTTGAIIRTQEKSSHHLALMRRPDRYSAE